MNVNVVFYILSYNMEKIAPYVGERDLTNRQCCHVCEFTNVQSIFIGWTNGKTRHRMNLLRSIWLTLHFGPQVKALEIQNVVHYDLKCDNVLLEPLMCTQSDEDFWHPQWPPLFGMSAIPFRVSITDFGQSKVNHKFYTNNPWILLKNKPHMSIKNYESPLYHLFLCFVYCMITLYHLITSLLLFSLVVHCHDVVLQLSYIGQVYGSIYYFPLEEYSFLECKLLFLLPC